MAQDPRIGCADRENQLYAMAAKAFDKRNYELTVEALGPVIRANDNAAALLLLAKAYCRLGNPRAAIAILTRLLREGAADSDVYFTRAVARLAEGRNIAASLKDAEAAALYAAKADGGEPLGDRPTDWLQNFLLGLMSQQTSQIAFGRMALIRRWRGRRPKAQGPIFAAMDYKNPDFSAVSKNIGDFLQTAAALRHLARLKDVAWTFDDPTLPRCMQRLRDTWTEEPQAAGGGRAHLAVFDRDFPSSLHYRYPGRTVWAIYNGWFCHSAFGLSLALPGPDNLQPLLVSFHLARPADLNETVVEWLKRHEPVGCRDWSTVYWLANQGVTCFFSGCLTLTLSNGPSVERDGKIYRVDVDGDAPDSNVSIKHHDLSLSRLPLGLALERALDRLRDYAHASAVETSRLHCALPAWSVGTPVTFKTPAPADRRFDGLIDADDTARTAMRTVMSDILRGTLSTILSGATVDEVRAIWRQSTAAQVDQTRDALLGWGVGAGMAEKPALPPAVPFAGITLAISFDTKFVEQAQVLLTSIREHTEAAIDLVLLVRGVDRTTAEVVASALQPASLKIIDMEGWLADLEIELAVKITVSTMDRLRLPELLPDVDRLLYLDCDTLIFDDIAKLAAQDLGPHGIAARPTRNASASNLAHAIERRCKSLPRDKAIELRRWGAGNTDLAAPYFNAGVLVLSLARLRAMRFVERTTDLVARFGVHDQDALNLALGGAYAALPIAWNVMPTVDFTQRPSLVHWVGGLKPWGARPVRFAAHWRRVHRQTMAMSSRRDKQRPDLAADHWTKPESYLESWNDRAETAAALISPGAHVLDIGAGARMSLRDYLPVNCRYTPADKTKWAPNVIIVDLETLTMPSGDFDVIVMLGVLEYVSRPGAVLRCAKARAKDLLFSYCHPKAGFDPLRRRKMGWINAVSPAKLHEWLGNIGWHVERQITYNENEQFEQKIYSCRITTPALSERGLL